jgi:hypothetical protein
MNPLICTIIVWGGMHYATPKWMEKQIPDWMWSEYEILIAPYGTSLSVIDPTIDYETTALIGFSAGGIDVLKNYDSRYAFIGLIDPSTRPSFLNGTYDNAAIVYNPSVWGTTNKSLRPMADRINATGGDAERVQLKHSDIPKYFFNKHFKQHD